MTNSTVGKRRLMSSSELVCKARQAMTAKNNSLKERSSSAMPGPGGSFLSGIEEAEDDDVDDVVAVVVDDDGVDGMEGDDEEESKFVEEPKVAGVDDDEGLALDLEDLDCMSKYTGFPMMCVLMHAIQESISSRDEAERR